MRHRRLVNTRAVSFAAMSAESMIAVIAVVVAVVLLVVLIPKGGSCCGARRPACGRMHAHAAMHPSSSPADAIRDTLNGVTAPIVPLQEKPLRLSASSAALKIPDMREHEVREFATIVA